MYNCMGCPATVHEYCCQIAWVPVSMALDIWPIELRVFDTNRCVDRHTA